MGTTANNLAIIQSLYATWSATKGNCPDAIGAAFADGVRLTSMDDSQPGLTFARPTATRTDVVRYFTGILDEWDMVHHTPDELFGDGDRVAMFGRVGWRNKQTGKTAECRIANFWRLEDGKVVEFIDVFDSARAVAAATP